MRGKNWEKETARTKLGQLLEKHDITHVTDLFKIKPVNTENLAYFRLHGSPRYNLKYTYSNQHLQWLNQELEEYNQKLSNVLVFFNNYAMYRDARRLLTLKGKANSLKALLDQKQLRKPLVHSRNGL